MIKSYARIIFVVAIFIISIGLIACSAPEATAVPTAPSGISLLPVTAVPPTVAVPADNSSLSWSSPPAMEIDLDKSYTAVFEMEKGVEFTIELYAKEAPTTVNSFVFLSRQGFYDGVTFHRVIEGFMAQGGDRHGKPPGTGNPGYKFENEIHPDLHHDSVGILSMANSGMRNGKGTNGSQFFITFVPTPFLDGHGKDCRATSCHTVFGKVIEGMDVVNNISIRDPGTATSPGDAIKTIRINEN